ncbi:hypothetical protein NPIL_81211 [Nephila pilipes]|uniref:Reverse transcriptase/retrotransposon-derived protein RNase H-like domain-containing protein n=1 Tax=Nephila pilipes TaxID=299642 RepID=A0A8X6TLL8_NEPPI|nr:hypothetical protein NPIL_81211 [Nephila pilipes]
MTKKKKFESSDAIIRSFEKGRTDLAETLVLCHPFATTPFTSRVDVSNSAIWAAMQQPTFGRWKLLVYFLEKFCLAQQNCSAYDQELLTAFMVDYGFLGKQIYSLQQLKCFTDHPSIYLANFCNLILRSWTQQPVPDLDFLMP